MINGREGILLVYHEIFLYTNYFFDFMEGFEIVKRIIDTVPKDHLEGYNFNRYSEEGGDRVPHITVRLNLKNEIPGEVISLLDDMKREGYVTCWRIGNPYVKPFKEYSQNHHIAHETSTACAFAFYNEMNHNRNEFQRFINDKIRYLSAFLPLWLRKCGFKKLDGVTVLTSNFIENLADKCSKAFKETVDKNRITDKYLFTERFIHTFNNCICVSLDEEASIMFSLMQRMSYADLSASLEI